MIECSHADIGYSEILIHDVHVTAKPGEMIYLAGKNGCGKSTLIKTLLGIIPPISGGIFFRDRPLNEYKNTQEAVTAVFSQAYINPQFTTYDLVKFGLIHRYPLGESLSEQDESKVRSLLDMLDLEQYSTQSISELSDGNLQKAMLGRAIATGAKVLLLDEPTTHLDPKNKKIIFGILKDLAKIQNKTVIFSSHDWMTI